MTKVRAPSTFEDAIDRIVGRITIAKAAEVVGKGERVIRYWSDPDANRSPSIEEAALLDAAYLEAGGGEPPILAVYQLLLDRRVTPPADSAELAKVSGVLAKEVGEGLAALFKASQPGSTQADRMIAERELTDVGEALNSSLRVLGSPANVTPLRSA